MEAYLRESGVGTLGAALEARENFLGGNSEMTEGEWNIILSVLGFKPVPVEKRKRVVDYYHGFLRLRTEKTQCPLITWKKYRVRQEGRGCRQATILSNDHRVLQSFEGKVGSVGEYLYLESGGYLGIFKGLPSDHNMILFKDLEGKDLIRIFESIGGLSLILGNSLYEMLSYISEVENPFSYGYSGEYKEGRLELYTGGSRRLAFEGFGRDFFDQITVIPTIFGEIEILVNPNIKDRALVFDAFKLEPIAAIWVSTEGIFSSQTFVISQGMIFDLMTGALLADLSPLFLQEKVREAILGITLKDDKTGYNIWIDGEKLTEASKYIIGIESPF